MNERKFRYWRERLRLKHEKKENFENKLVDERKDSFKFPSTSFHWRTLGFSPSLKALDTTLLDLRMSLATPASLNLPIHVWQCWRDYQDRL